ncbi:MAG: DUF2110 family protein [Candidatus Bathyarchaeota archaeon]
MVGLTLLEKLYGPEEALSQNAFQEILTDFTSGLDAEVAFVGKNSRNWIQVESSGSDTKVAINYLRQRFGLVPSLHDIPASIVIKGKIVDSAKVGYGLYVDIGVSNTSPVDVLIPLHRLRSHIVDGKKLSLREIVDVFCLHDNFPLSILLLKTNVDGNKMWAEPSDKQVEMFKNWQSTYLDRVIVLGSYRDQISLALERSGIKRDIAKIDELGFLEYALLCKLGTDAPGIIKVLGKFLPGVSLYAFSPRKVNNLLGEILPHLK